MSLQPLLNQIDELQAAIEAAGKFDPEVLKKINYKFRLDWNYHSNAMEGNSLTKEETRSVMVGLSVEGKIIKDVLEMKNHDQVVGDILKIGKAEMRLSEKRIQEIHKAIIYEDDPDKKQKIGKWKTENNYLYNYKGEKFDFLEYTEVPDAMHQLINWLNTQTEQFRANKNGIYPAQIAFEFHLKYLTIHPFYDGNGRTARILTNLILISFGYPPVIIKKQEKEAYYLYLGDIQGYGGSPDLYYEFMYKLLIHSQELVLKAIHGDSIEESDDLDKKLLLLEKELEAIDPDNTIIDQFNNEVFLKMYTRWISDLLRKAIYLTQKFNKYFANVNHYISLINGSISISYKNEDPNEIIQKLTQQLANNGNRIDSFGESSLVFSTNYMSFIKGGLQTFNCSYSFNVRFDATRYYVSVNTFSDKRTPGKSYEFDPHLLHKEFTTQESELLLKIFGDTIFQHVDFYTKQHGLR